MHGILRQAAARHQVVWDEFDAAKLDEYRAHGKVIASPQDFAKPDGTPLFLSERTANTDAGYTLTRVDLQVVAQGMLGRVLSNAELAAVEAELPGVINWMDAIEYTIWSCQQGGQVGRSADGQLPVMES